jgi:hypothetical protein
MMYIIYMYIKAYIHTYTNGCVCACAIVYASVRAPKP